MFTRQTTSTLRGAAQRDCCCNNQTLPHSTALRALRPRYLTTNGTSSRPAAGYSAWSRSRPTGRTASLSFFNPTLNRRATSTAAEATASAGYSIRNKVVGLAALAFATYGYFYFTDTRASVHKYVVVPILRQVFPDAEDAHHAGVLSLKTLHSAGLNPRERGNQDADGILSVKVFGHALSNPLGLSAGLDKNAEVVDPLFDLGPAVVEVGGITPLPQEGNPKPRFFRVTSQEALINRYGLNSKGAAYVARLLRERVRRFADANGFGLGKEAEDFILDGHAGVPPGSLAPGKLLAVQIAKNKVTPETDTAAVARDYVSCVQQLGQYADILVVNVSSPNTPGLRTLQKSEPLEKILTSVVDAAQAIDRKTKPFVMVKVSPDQDSEEEINGIVDAVWSSNVDGVIVANTTTTRPIAAPHQLTQAEASTLQEQGGYSGPALFHQTLDLVRRYRKALDAPLQDGDVKGVPAKTIFASGGITSGDDALKVLNAGASVAMSYTALSYQGTGYFTQAKADMKQLVKEAVKSKNPIQSGKI